MFYFAHTYLEKRGRFRLNLMNRRFLLPRTFLLNLRNFSKPVKKLNKRVITVPEVMHMYAYITVILHMYVQWIHCNKKYDFVQSLRYYYVAKFLKEIKTTKLIPIFRQTDMHFLRSFFIHQLKRTTSGLRRTQWAK